MICLYDHLPAKFVNWLLFALCFWIGTKKKRNYVEDFSLPSYQRNGPRLTYFKKGSTWSGQSLT